MSEYKLFYFNVRARAEPVRMIFHYADQKFEDKRLTSEEFFKLKPNLPGCQVPVLEVDGKELAQSPSIIRFLAKRFKLAGRDDFEEAKADEIFCVYYDRFQEQLPYMLFKLGNPKFPNGDQYYNESFVPSARKTLDFYSTIIKPGQKSVLSSGITYIDFVIAEHIQTIEDWFPETKEKYGDLIKFKEHVYGLPQLKSYIQCRNKTTC